MEKNGQIYTASFFNREDYNGVCFSAANSYPKGLEYEYGNLESFKPPWGLVNRFKNDKLTWEEYTEHYIKHLNKVDTNKDIKTIKNILKSGQDVTLLCWERNTGYCHRRLLADWLSEKGFEIDKKNIK